MATQVQAAQVPQTVQLPMQWNPVTRVAFRFCLVYFGLYCLATQIVTSLIPLPNVDIPDPATFWPIRPVILWVAAHVLRIKRPLIYSETGSGDKTFDWVVVFCLLVIALMTTAIWAALGRRESYVTLHKWFRLFIRFALVGQLIGYGMSKAIPVQMPGTFLFRLVEPYGNFSPMGVLWSSIGAARSYEIFAGCAELLGGVLLIFPRTTTLGALVCLADMTQVFMLNMSYDVPVKLLSFHLILLSVFLLVPEFRRLTNVFVLNRTAGPSTQPELFASHRANRWAFIVQVVFGAVLLTIAAYQFWGDWHRQNDEARRKAPLYGLWNVDQMTIDGQIRSPLINDYDRFRRAIFELPDRMWFQRMDDSFASYGTAIDVAKRTIAMTKRDDKTWKGNLSFERGTPDQLTLDGEMGGHKVHMEMKRVDVSKMLLLSRGFHWVSENPFNR